jgi:hypothetical protein
VGHNYVLQRKVYPFQLVKVNWIDFSCIVSRHLFSDKIVRNFVAIRFLLYHIDVCVCACMYPCKQGLVTNVMCRLSVNFCYCLHFAHKYSLLINGMCANGMILSQPEGGKVTSCFRHCYCFKSIDINNVNLIFLWNYITVFICFTMMVNFLLSWEPLLWAHFFVLLFFDRWKWMDYQITIASCCRLCLPIMEWTSIPKKQNHCLSWRTSK